jgi:hypothetical protein
MMTQLCSPYKSLLCVSWTELVSNSKHWAANRLISQDKSKRDGSISISQEGTKRIQIIPAFISLRSRYGTIRGFRFAPPMANELGGIKLCKCFRGPFLPFSLLPKRPDMQRLSPLPDHVSFSHHTFLHLPLHFPTTRSAN